MEARKFSRYLALALGLLVLGCSSGRKLLEKGDYDAAVYQAASRLQRDTNNPRALKTLRQAYQYAEEYHLDRIDNAKLSADPMKWERLIGEYEALNSLMDAVKSCPSCRQVVVTNSRFVVEIEEARKYAAEARYNRAMQYLSENNRESAKKAYFDFEKAESLSPGYRDARLKLNEAYQAALLRVVVEPVGVNRGLYELSNEYFQDKIYEYLTHYESRSFVKFYTQTEAEKTKLVPDHVLSLGFDDFNVGQTYVKERVEDLKRDSVKVGTQDGKDVYGTVKAKYSLFEKTITSGGLLNMQVIDWKTKKTIAHEKIPGTFVWRDEWASYKGDDRALSDAQKRLTRKKEVYPPAPQDLFIEFTKPIYSQLTGRIQRFYNNY